MFDETYAHYLTSCTFRKYFFENAWFMILKLGQFGYHLNYKMLPFVIHAGYECGEIAAGKNTCD